MASNEEDAELLSLDSDSDHDSDVEFVLEKGKPTECKIEQDAPAPHCSSSTQAMGMGLDNFQNYDYAFNEDSRSPVGAPETVESGHEQSDSEGEEGSTNETERVPPQPRPRETASTTNSNMAVNDNEIMLSDDDDEGNDSGNATGESLELTPPANSSDDGNGGENAEANNASRYGLRRKHKIDYTEMEGGPDDAPDKKKLQKEVFDVFSLPVQKIRKFIQNPELADNYSKCKIFFLDGTDTSKINAVGRLFEICGPQFEGMFIQTRYNEENFNFLQNLLKSTTALGKLSYRYNDPEEAFHILKMLKELMELNHLPSLYSLKLVGLSSQEALAEKHLALLADMKTQFRSLELGDALWDNVQSGTLAKLLDNQKSTLESLIIHGGFRGGGDGDRQERIMMTFPKMERLKTLCICPNYTFLSEFKNPYSKKARVVTLGRKREEPIKITVKFSCDIPTLERVVFGNLIEIEDLLFSSLRKLKEFRCGSYWNLSIRFPTESSRKALMESLVTELQFPDALKDPSFTVKVAKHFPHLKKVWMFLPSVPVLRAFFKAFENSELEELYLKTQFDFESTMESCLLPRMADVLQKHQETETLLRTLKEYKHFDEYVRFHNIELPVEADDLMEGHSAGIRNLKNLKALHLEHIPRNLLIPIPDDERKWYDHNCKFMSTTFGYERYPLNYRCHKEILQLKLSEYTWRNVQIESEFTEEFHQAGFVDMLDSDVQVLGSYNYGSYTIDNQEEEDIFIRVRKGTSSGAHVKIMPSMLLPDIKAKPEGN